MRLILPKKKILRLAPPPGKYTQQTLTGNGQTHRVDLNNPIYLALSTASSVYFFTEFNGTTLYDFFGNFNGTLQSGPTWIPGFSGSALQFDGSSQYISLSDSFQPTPPYTILSWLFPTNISTGGTAMANADNGGNTGSFGIGVGSNFNAANKISVGWKGATAHFYDATFAPSANNWIFFGYTAVTVVATTTTTLYVNGTQDSTHSAVDTPSTKTGTSIGRFGAWNNAASYWPGNIGPTLILNTALNANQIQSIYNDPYFLFRPNLRTYYLNPVGVAPASSGGQRMLLGVGS